MWAIIPAAGNGARIQPLAFSKELLPVGSWVDPSGIERPRAVSEYIIERVILGGAQKICLVISPHKSDILSYYGGMIDEVNVVYVCQTGAAGLCDAIFAALPVIPADEAVLIGLPDTVWFPANGLATLPNDRMSFLLFPVERPELFDAVLLAEDGRVEEIRVKSREAATCWIWGALKLPGSILHSLHRLWIGRDRRDEYFGTLVNAWIQLGGVAWGVRSGTSYVDVGTIDGYRQAMQTLRDHGVLESTQTIMGRSTADMRLERSDT